MYYKVPIIDGVMDIDYLYLISAHYLPDTDEAVVMLLPGHEIRPSWELLNLAGFELHSAMEWPDTGI